MNNVQIIGNLTKDPQKVDGIDKTLCKLNVAVNEDYTKEDGTRPVDYFTVVVWGKPAENCLKYLKKGNKIGVVGKLKNRSWEADGGKKYVTEIMASSVEYLNTKKTAPTETDEPTVFEEKQKQTDIFNDDDLPF